VAKKKAKKTNGKHKMPNGHMMPDAQMKKMKGKKMSKYATKKKGRK